MRILLTAVVAVAALLVGPGLLDGPHAADDRAVAAPQGPPAPAPPVAAPPAPASPAAAPETPLLQMAAHGDGDSWRDTAGTEYRLGLVNAPEVDECYGTEATAERRRLLAGGFHAEVYAVDRYGRGVSTVTTADGVNVNVLLARSGFVDDRYLADFRHESPALAAELDVAFAEARAEGRGLWSACAPRPAAAPPVVRPASDGSCHPDYLTCVPVAGDGSGRGGANDLDCGDLPGAVQARQPDVDPYRLDADGDGIGCDTA